jgi:predicted HicB family RNase H-like nuclease
MGRKKKESEKMPAANSKTRPVRLDLPPDIHRLLRLVAANADVSMATYARNHLVMHLKEAAKNIGIKE